MKQTLQFLVSAAIILALGSCGNKNAYTITGTLDSPQFDGGYVYLWGNSNDPLDSTLVENCCFTFTGVTDTVCKASIHTAEDMDSGRYITFFLEPGNIQLTITAHDETDRIGGTPLNDEWQNYTTAVAKANDEVYKSDKVDTAALQRYYDMRQGKIEMDTAELSRLGQMEYELYKEFNAKRVALLWDLYHRNEHNVLAVTAMSELLWNDTTLDNVEILDSVLKSADKMVYSQFSVYVDLKRAAQATAKGNPYVDVNGIVKTLESDTWTEHEGSLKELIDGHYALVDFWASWCGPCRQEISENLIRIHEKYNKKGLVVVGLDVWDDIVHHANAVKDLGITYPQLIDTVGTGSKSYGVEGIPEILLIGPDGTIIERGLRGESIEKAVVEALKK